MCSAVHSLLMFHKELLGCGLFGHNLGIEYSVMIGECISKLFHNSLPASEFSPVALDDLNVTNLIIELLGDGHQRQISLSCMP